MIFLGILFFLVIVDQFTPINLSSALFVKREFAEYKYLKDGVSSKKYEIVRVSDNAYLTLTYDRENNFFLLNDVDGIKKIDANGNEKMYVQQRNVDLPYRTPYAFNDSLVFDFTKEIMNPEPFQEIIFPENKSEDDWIALFENYYNQADIVIYGDPLVSQESDYSPIYMKIGDKWILMYLHGYFFFRKDVNDQNEFDHYASKCNQLVLLKDVEKNVLSEWLTRQDYQKGQVEDGFSYSPQVIKTLAFQKDFVDETITYTPIPIVIAGTGYYRLLKDGESISFKENGLKMPFAKANNFLYYFSVPKKFEGKCKVSFLKLGYPTNSNESGSKGWYVIRQKKVVTQ